MGGPTENSGAAATRKFRTWLGARQKDRANVLKQARLEKEEKEELRKRGAAAKKAAADKDGKK